MINLRIIARIFSLVIIVEGFFMLLSAGVSWLYKEPCAYSFLYSALITLISGLIVFTPLKDEERVTGKKEGYIIITGIWLIFSLFGTLPYLISGSIHGFTDSFFESVSGFTTTGSTILTDVESMQHGILFWRCLTQWLGGMGIIFISLYALPVFRSVYIHVPAGDFSGQPSDKIHPRIKDTAIRLIIIYVILTLVEAVLLVTGGMPLFDAVCHSFSTLSTGGFTTGNNSLSAYQNPFVLVVITIFMFVSGTNMAFIYFTLKGNLKKILGNQEFLFYVIVCGCFMLIVATVHIIKSGVPAGQAFLEGSFHVISIITTTGFFIQDHKFWGELILIIFFVLMLSGGMSGSTSGGIKIVRLFLISKNSRYELTRLVHPNAFIPVRLDNRVIPQTTIYNLLVFTTLYFLTICSAAILLSFMGYDLVTSFSTAASMLGNIGTGLGTFGPFSNYSMMPHFGKWLLSALMIAGRLELFTVMVLFSRGFYKH